MGSTPLWGPPPPRIPPYIVSYCQFGGDNTLDNAKKFLGKKLSFLGVFIIYKFLDMKRTVRITESDITRLVKKIVNEQERIDDPSDKYFMEIDYIANYAMDEAMEPEDIEMAIDEISDIMGEADSDEDLSDDELDDIISYGGQVIMELESFFDSEEPMYEQSTNSKVVDDWTKFPCVAKLKDAVSPKGEKSKRGEDVFKDLLFYSNGRCMDITNKSKSFYKCHPSGAIVVSDDPNIDMDTIDVNEV